MGKSSVPLKPDNQNQKFEEKQESFKCSICHGIFSKPILVTLSSCGQVQTYYACPHCLSKVTETKNSKSKRGKGAPPSVEKAEKTVVTPESNVECKHFIGYLKKRPKDKSIPDECLLCEKMIDCLIH